MRMNFYICILLLSLLPSILLTHEFNSFTNTIFNNGKWVPTKTFLKKGVTGAIEYFFSRNALAHGHLNLSCWHGYQEVVYRRRITPQEVSFNFKLAKDAYIVFEFNKDADQFSGIRLSLNKKYEDLYFTSNDEGEFLYKETLKVPTIHINAWNHMKVIFEQKQVSFFLNGELIANIKISVAPQRQIAFRSGFRQALIDKVIIREGSSIIREDFRNNSLRIFLIIMALVGGANFILWNIIGSHFQYDFKRSLFTLIICNLIVSLFLSVIVIVDYFTVDRYFHMLRTMTIKDAAKRYWLHSDEGYIYEQIENKYANNKAKDTLRIVFIGGSQTWGAGARNENETFVKRIEERLNSNPLYRGHVECINGAVSGLDSTRLLPLYIRDLLTLKPQIVVINLSNNEHNSLGFTNALRRFADLNRLNGIKMAFVLEPNSIENSPSGLRMHEIMRRVGWEKGIPVWDMHGYLAQNYDKGFLWWDFVHLTSFGQKLAADFLFNKISQEFLTRQPSTHLLTPSLK